MKRASYGNIGEPRQGFMGAAGIGRACMRAVPAGLFALFATLVLAVLPVEAAKQRFFETAPGFKTANDLDDGYVARIDSLVIVIKDAFDGAQTHSEAEVMAYEMLNRIHIDTRESVVRRRLLFKAGDSVRATTLRETEKNLRGEEFLADAYVEVGQVEGEPDSTGLRQVKTVARVTTFDQWTLAVSPNAYITGGEWVWWVGLVESNILGTGQRLGFFINHGLERDSYFLDYANTFFTPARLALAGNYTWADDGYSYALSMSRPLRSRGDRWAFSLSASGSSLNEYQYLSGNLLHDADERNALPDSLKKKFRSTNYIGYWDDVGTHSAYASVTRAFGHKLKSSLTPYYSRYDKYLKGEFNAVNGALRNVLEITDEPSLYLRRNELLGLSASLYMYDYKTVTNFRNLKWSENIETGWRVTAAAAQNQTWLGAEDDDWQLSQSLVFNNAWFGRLFVNSSASVSTYVNDQGDFVDGSVSGSFESQLKPVWWAASLVSASYAHVFATADSRQYTLGEDNGLNGYPNFFYAGKARALFGIEQRFFPGWEVLTVVPAFALYLNAGNAYESYSDVDLADLHYAAGFGLRFGMSRSVQKIVNHANFSFPLGNDNLSSFAFGWKVTKGL